MSKNQNSRSPRAGQSFTQAFWQTIARTIKKNSSAYRHDEKLAVAGILVQESGLPLEEWCLGLARSAGRHRPLSERPPRPPAAPPRADWVHPDENSVTEPPEPVLWAGMGRAADAGQGPIFERALRDARRLAMEANPDLEDMERASRLLHGLAELFRFATDQLSEQPDGPERAEIERLRRLYTSSRRNFLKVREVLLRRLQDPAFKVVRIRGRHPTKLPARDRKALYADTHARVLEHRPLRCKVSATVLRPLLLKEFCGDGDEGVPQLHELNEMQPSLIARRITVVRIRIAETRLASSRQST